MTDHPQPLDAVMDERRQLLNVAYRLLGSLVEAEDAVQETYARWYALAPGEREAVDNPAAWLTKVASRICLDQLRSAGSAASGTSASGSPSRSPTTPIPSPTQPTGSPSTSR